MKWKRSKKAAQEAKAAQNGNSTSGSGNGSNGGHGSKSPLGSPTSPASSDKSLMCGDEDEYDSDSECDTSGDRENNHQSSENNASHHHHFRDNKDNSNKPVLGKTEGSVWSSLPIDPSATESFAAAAAAAAAHGVFYRYHAP